MRVLLDISKSVDPARLPGKSCGKTLCKRVSTSPADSFVYEHVNLTLTVPFISILGCTPSIDECIVFTKTASLVNGTGNPLL